MRAVFKRREELAPGIWRCYVTPLESLQYLPGQYLKINLPQVINDSRGPGRTMTITSIPSERDISFVYRFPEPASLYKQVLQKLEPGEEIHLGDVLGDLVLPKSASVPLVFVAGGIGMASYEGMLRELQRTGEKREIHLFYSLRFEDDDAYRDLLKNFPFASQKRYISPNRVSAEIITKVITPDALVYLSGSERFVLGLRDDLHHLGYGDTQVIFDFYDGYTEL